MIWYVKYVLGLDNDVKWHQKEFLTQILGFSWCKCWCKAAMHLNRAVEVSTQNPRSHHWCRLFPAARFCFSRNHQSEQHLGCTGCISMGSGRQASDSRSHSALFPIAKSFHRSSSIPRWCNGCRLTKRPIFRYCWPSRSTTFSRPSAKTFALISCASSEVPLKAMIVQPVLRDASHLKRASADLRLQPREQSLQFLPSKASDLCVDADVKVFHGCGPDMCKSNLSPKAFGPDNLYMDAQLHNCTFFHQLMIISGKYWF